MAKPVENAGAACDPAQDDRGWIRDYQSWRRARLERVQASARVWLGVLTTLVGLLGSVVLFKGGDLVTGVTNSGWFQFFLILLVGLVFATAILAVIAGGSATWGGLGDIAPRGEASGLSGPSPSAPQAEALPGGEGARAPANASDRRSGRRQRWFKFWLRLTGEPPSERDRLLAIAPKSELTSEHEEPWKRYRTGVLNSADRRRAYLHASRALGVAAAVFIAMLAVLAVIAGTVAPASTDVIVIHGGRSTCVSSASSSKFVRVSQVIPVSSC